MPRHSIATHEITPSENQLTRDKIHRPAQRHRRAHKEHEAVDSIAEHAPGRFAHGYAEDHGREQGEEHNRRKVRGPEHLGFPPGAKIVRVHGGDHIQQPGHYDKARTIIGGRHPHLVGAQTQ